MQVSWLCSPRLPQRGQYGRKKPRLQLCMAQIDIGYEEKSYTAKANAEYWSRRPVEVIQRAAQVATGFGIWFADTRLRKGQNLESISGLQAERLRQLLTTLGPAFVKIGQAVASRPDVMPQVYTSELEKLQDQIPPFPDIEAMQVVVEELGRPVDSVFSRISASPIAAASLGQVYRARLRDGGQEVAVKVQRPHIRDAMARDVFILRWLLTKVRAWRKVNSDLAGLLDEWATSLFRELDYRREARNGQRFKDLYGGMQGVYAPHMYQGLTTEKVLIMEWVEGVRLKGAGTLKAPAEKAQDLSMVDIGVQCSLEQMLEIGFYHSDPHPGNLLRTPQGKLAYIDFGMMGEINPNIRRSLITATLHLVNREFGELADDFVQLGLLPPGSDREAIVPALTGVFSEAVAGGVSNISFGQLSGNLGRTMYQYSFRIPPFYTLLVRSLTVLEGIALSSNPNYKVLGAAYPWIARRLITNTQPELRETLKELLYKNGNFQFGRLDSLLRQAALSPNRSKKAQPQPQSSPQPGANKDLVVESGGQALELLLSKDGEFVYGILVDELAKGLDAAWRLAADSFIADARTRALSVLGMQDGASSRGSLALLPQQPVLQLLRPLLNAQTLSTVGDRAQLEGLSRLASALQDIGSVGQTSGSRPAQSGDNPTASAGSILQWLANEASSLPPEPRAQALRTPLLLLAKLSERITARALRSFFGTPMPAATSLPEPAPSKRYQNGTTALSSPADPSRPSLPADNSSSAPPSKAQAQKAVGKAAAKQEDNIMLALTG
ncbi:hypothetical protein WJX73_008900 [Symbiochloris irregularis]|uniref:Protein kinase domain-containing protein n=1 Tax=Symbiochloris irregularis TaxID=706552 RepID=A0AAW1PMY5_9CHLO